MTVVYERIISTLYDYHCFHSIMGIFSKNDQNHLLRNHLSLLFKYCMYKCRTDNINIHTIVGKIKSILNIEKQIFSTEKFNKKWATILPILI